MNKSLHIFTAIIICLLMVFPAPVFAETYNLSGTDMSINLDDSMWYVFTKDNIENNPELAYLGISYDDMYKELSETDLYLEAAALLENDEFMELYISKSALDSGVANLSNYDNDEILDLVKDIAADIDSAKYFVYENQYKFAFLEYFDSDSNYFHREYITVVNKDLYILSFESTTPFSAIATVEMNKAVDSIQFNIDTSLKEDTTPSFWEMLSKLLYAVLAICVYAPIKYAISKAKNKKHSND